MPNCSRRGVKQVLVFCVTVAFLQMLAPCTKTEVTLNSQSAAAERVGMNTTNDARPTGLRLVMIGDSITRYQYLSLAYFLRHGRWFDPNKTQAHLVNEKSFLGWDNFYQATTNLLSPLEK